MVNIRERVFLISGTNFLQRQRVIENIKKRIAKDNPAFVNTLTFYGKEPDTRSLQKELFTVPFGKSRMVLFKNFQDLVPPVRNFLFVNLDKILAVNYIVLETDREYYQLQKDKTFLSDKFFNLVSQRAASFKVSSLRKAAIGDFIGSIRKKDLVSSLHILEELFKEGGKEKSLGPQIIGILVGRFSYLADEEKSFSLRERNPNSFQNTHTYSKSLYHENRCFQYLWEADRALKEKGLNSRLVIEILLVKLFSEYF